MSYRIGIGRIWHESNSFFAIGTRLEDFESYPGGLVVGQPLFNRPDRADEITGMLKVFSRDNQFEPVPLLGASLEPSGAIMLPEPSFGQKKVATSSHCASSGAAHSSVQ